MTCLPWGRLFVVQRTASKKYAMRPLSRALTFSLFSVEGFTVLFAVPTSTGTGYRLQVKVLSLRSLAVTDKRYRLAAPGFHHGHCSVETPREDSRLPVQKAVLQATCRQGTTPPARSRRPRGQGWGLVVPSRRARRRQHRLVAGRRGRCRFRPRPDTTLPPESGRVRPAALYRRVARDP